MSSEVVANCPYLLPLFLNPFLFQFSLFKRSPAVVISHEKERKNERARKKEKKKNDHSFDDEKFE